MSDPVFLLGAGFNRDAARHAQLVPAQSYVAADRDCNYPLREELPRLCFGKECAGDSDAIEEKFSRAIRERNWTPLKRLYDALLEADYRVAWELLPNERNPANPYAQFFERFRGCHFLTLNYDSLPEILLLRCDAWYPQDGYGVPVEVDLLPGAEQDIRSCRSKSYVLHLHGTLCVYARRYDPKHQPDSTIQYLHPRETPAYVFEPAEIGHCFPPYASVVPDPLRGYEPVEARVVAPVPHKAGELQRHFVQEVHHLAERILESCPGLVVIGYSFNVADRSSYQHLLAALARSPHPEAVIVDPEAEAIAGRLAARYRKIQWKPRSQTFTEWADVGFPGAA